LAQQAHNDIVPPREISDVEIFQGSYIPLKENEIEIIIAALSWLRYSVEEGHRSLNISPQGVDKLYQHILEYVRK
jgi:hypothetical protein